MKTILQEIPADILAEELKRATFVRDTVYEGNEIYSFSGNDCPYLALQVGILREISFREAGGGTGASIDLDQFDEISPPSEYASLVDKNEKGFLQQITWNPDAQEIIGGYRYAPVKNFWKDDKIDSPTMELFEYTEAFSKDYAPYAIELGRSFIQPKYQSIARGRKSMYALDNLFDGLGSILVDTQRDEMKYFFGKMTMYPSYSQYGRDMIDYYLQKHFSDKESLIIPKPYCVPPVGDSSNFPSLFVGQTEEEDKRILKKALRELNNTLPAMFNRYPEMSHKMRYYGKAINDHCGNVEESAIMISFSEISQKYWENHVMSYEK